jgi:hypothetical protein
MIPNGVVNQDGAFVRTVSAASVFIANPQDPANSVVTKAAAIRRDERRIIFLEFRRAMKVADVKPSAGKERQDAHKSSPNTPSIAASWLTFSPTDIASPVGASEIFLTSRG